MDVCSAEAYQASHIARAINIPLAELKSQLGELNKAKWIITYCTPPSEESSARAASILLDSGFQKVTPIRGGFESWIDAYYPVEW